MPRILLFVVAVLVHATTLAGGADSALRFRLRGEHDVIVPVILNGQGPYRFLLDTGSGRSAITRTLAERLGLEFTGRTRMVTPSGSRAIPLARVRRMRLGAAEAFDVLAMVLSDDDLGARGDVDGLVGQDVLGGTVFTIDYGRRLLVWGRGGVRTVDPGVRLPLSSEDGRLLVELPQARGAPPLRLVPDSGADSLVFFEADDRVSPAMTPVDAVGLRTLSGRRVARRVVVDALDVGDVRLRDQMALVVERPGGAAREDARRLGDGLLPLHVFEQVSFDVAAGYLVVRGRRR